MYKTWKNDARREGAQRDEHCHLNKTVDHIKCIAICETRREHVRGELHVGVRYERREAREDTRCISKMEDKQWETREYEAEESAGRGIG